MKSPLIQVANEGDIENCVKMVYKAMKDKKKNPVHFQFFLSTQWMNVQFLRYLSDYLRMRKARKVNHVKIDIYVEEKEEGAA